MKTNTRLKDSSKADPQLTFNTPPLPKGLINICKDFGWSKAFISNKDITDATR